MMSGQGSSKFDPNGPLSGILKITPYDPLAEYIGGKWHLSESGTITGVALEGLSFNHAAEVARAIAAHNKEMLSPPKE